MICPRFSRPLQGCSPTTQIIITFAASTMADLENVVNSELRSLNCWLITNRLSLNVAKTEFMLIGSNQRTHTLSNNQD